MRTGIPNFKHFILKRLPDGSNGGVCWIMTQETGEQPWSAPNGWNYDNIRKVVKRLPVGGTTTLFINKHSPFVEQFC